MNDAAAKLVGKAQETSFIYKIGSLYFSPSYWQAVAIILLLFLLVLSFARLRRLYLEWSLKGALSMLGIGFFLALILEGFLLIGGKTALTEVLGWENAPKPISTMLDLGRKKLVDVLGVTTEIPSSKAEEELNAEKLIEIYEQIPQKEAAKVKGMICKPN